MDVILVHGLWLDASSWDAVIPALEAAGHRPHPLTMPGVGAPAAESEDIGMADWVAAAAAEIDRAEGPVAIVGHSGGGNVVYGAADARVDRVARIVYVDSFPPAEGGSIWEFPVVDGVIPFPGWDAFDEPDIADLDEATRESVAARTRSVPRRVPTDPIHLTDERRREIPATMLAGVMSSEKVREILEAAPPWAAEVAATKNLEIVDLRTGHWPMYSAPDLLARSLVKALA
jgi:pimeloyl-ACP methyl ester carboxylesterase